MPDFFDDLYRKAMRREHPRLVMHHTLKHHVGITSGDLALARLADGLLSLGDEFEDRMRIVANQNRIRLRDVKYLCPICEQSNCPAAVAMMPMPAHVKQFVAHLLSGGQAYQHEDDDPGT